MTIVGSCPNCGAPIYAPSVRQGITPPPSTYTCMCSQTATISYATTTKVYNSILETEN